MVSLPLDKFLSNHVFAFVFIFSRLGSIIMMVPGIGESYVSAKFRMFLALSISFLLLPALYHYVPSPPDEISQLVMLIGYEIFVGIFFGTLLRLIMDALETAGTIIALQTGLSSATVFNPTLASQSPLPSATLGVVGTTLIFVTGLDHTLLRGMVDTYTIFPPNGPSLIGDMTQLFIQTMGRSFATGVELAMPFLVMGLLMFLALGLIQKLMPVIQLYLITIPLQIWGGLFLIGVTLASIMTAWLHFFDETLAIIFSR